METGQQERPSRLRLPTWQRLDRRPPIPDYLDTGQPHVFEHDVVQSDSESTEDALFDISIVPSAARRAKYKPVSPMSDSPGMSSVSRMESKDTKPISYKLTIPPPQPSRPLSPVRDAAFIFSTCMAQFLSLAALAQSVAPLFIIGDSFGVHDPGQLSWYTAGYSLTVGTFILPAGRLGDMYGHKRMYLIGWVWFTIWSLVAGVSVYSGSTLFNIARAFQGIGPATLVPNAMALIGKTYPVGMKKNFIFSAFGAGGPTGFAIGAVFAALFSQLTWWPWTFFALAITTSVMGILAAIAIPADNHAPQSPAQQTKPQFDYLGALTGVGGLVLINFAWNQGPVVGWDVPYVYALLIIGFVFMAAFFVIELYFTRYPLIPIRGLKKEAGFALACIAAGWGSHGIWTYYLFWFLQRLRNESALLSAAQNTPVAFVGVVFAMSVGFLMKKMRPAYIMLLAMAFFLTGSLLLATTPIDQIYWSQTFLSLIIMPGGMNLSFPAGTILLSNALPKENQGIAASLVSTTVNYSISIGLGFAGTIDKYVSPDPSAPGGVNLLRGFRGAWYFGVGLDGLGMLIALYFVWVTRPSKPGKTMCLKTAIRNEKEKRTSQRQLTSESSAETEERKHQGPNSEQSTESEERKHSAEV